MKYLSIIFILLSFLFAFLFWIADSVYEYFMFQRNLEFMLYQEPLSFWDSLVSNIPPHALFNRLSFLAACLSAGVISFFLGARWLESKTRYEVLSNNFPNGALFLFDNQFKIVAAGGKALEQMGLSSKGISKKTLAEAFSEIWNMMRSHCQEALDGQESFFSLDHANRSYNLTTIPVSGIQVSKKQGILIVQDVTRHRRAERDREKLQGQLQQAQKMEAVGTLAGGISHDFNNLLQAITGYTQLLIMEKDADNPDVNSLTAIQDASHRASDLVRQLLLFSRKAESVKRQLELQHEVEQARKILERTIPKMIQIQVTTGDRLWAINADPVQIEQMLLNLGTNAADAMPDGGKLFFEMENSVLDEEFTNLHLGARPGRYVTLTVSDTGQGIDQETIKKIFDPFFTTKEFGKGTGLGLASVYGIVKSHGGYINCYSEVNQGTTFKIYFPAVVRSGIEADKDFEPAPMPRGAETILLVDDEDSIRKFAQQALVKFGYVVMTASSGEEALTVYLDSSKKIDLVVMDLGMPGMGGHRCLQELLRIDPGARVIIASGYSINGQVKNSLEAGAKGYVGKPYQLADLLNTVRGALDYNP